VELLASRDRARGLGQILIAAAAAMVISAAAGCRGAPPTKPAGSPTATATATASATPTPAPQLSEAQRQFAAAFVSASNARSVDAMRKLVLPKSLACYNKETRPSLDQWISRPFRYTIPADYKVSFSSYDVAPRRSPLFKSPAQPTGVMQIEFGAPGGRKIKLPRLVREEKNNYYLVVPCLTRKGASRFKIVQARHAGSMHKARAAYGQLQDPLRSQLTTLIKQGREHDAVSVCMHDMHLDRRTAAGVVDILTGLEPP
jgi:hypothetical protein